MSYRLVRVLALVAATLLLAGAAPNQSQAQSFFQQLFGFGSAPKKHNRRRVQPRPNYDLYARRQYGYGAEWRPRRSSGSYRTICVRTCDGYYFPISDSTPRRNFHRDSDRCRASCGGQGKLYYMPKGSMDTDRMMDLTGRTYKSSKTAYKYRKRLIAGCACRPMPWSASQRARHAGYAQNERRIAELAEQRRLAKERIDDGEDPIVVAQNVDVDSPPDDRLAADDAADGLDPAATDEQSVASASGTDVNQPDDNSYVIAQRPQNRPAAKAKVVTTSISGSSAIPQFTMDAPTISLRSRTNRALRKRNRKAIARRKPRRKKKYKPTYALGGWTGSSKQKYRWPGD